MTETPKLVSAEEAPKASRVRHEFHNYHVTEETMGDVLDKGVFKGCRLVFGKIATSDVGYEEAERLLDEGRYSITSTRIVEAD